MNKNLIPNTLTFLNLTSGMLSILFTLTNNPKLSAFMILLAALIDRYDGKIARRFSAVSPIGKELDSLADLVSFGAAPSVLCWGLFLNTYGVIGYIIAILFPIAGAYRLARFNVTRFDNVYSGVPITIAGGLVALDCLVSIYGVKHYLVSSIIFIVLSYLMVSKIRIQKR